MTISLKIVALIFLLSSGSLLYSSLGRILFHIPPAIADPTAAPIEPNNPQIATTTAISWCVTGAMMANWPQTVNIHVPRPTRIWVMVMMPTWVVGWRKGIRRAVPRRRMGMPVNTVHLNSPV